MGREFHLELMIGISDFGAKETWTGPRPSGAISFEEIDYDN